jgi:phosphatidate phosphatase LPIN
VSFPLQPRDTVRERAPSSQHRSRSPIPEADGGRLEADGEDPYKIWLDFEGQRLGFDISLCGDAIRNEAPIVGAQRFEEQRVTYKQLMDDAGVVHSHELVVRWDDE